MTDRPRLISSGRSHIGIVRAENQDRLTQFSSPFGEVFMTADGMGGAKGGTTAAEMVVEGFRNELLSLPGTMSHLDAFRTAANRVTAQVHAMGNGGNPDVAGMGSTVVLALVRDSKLVVAHVGDSRAYLYRQGHLTRLTRDHSVVQQMVDAGMISEEEAQSHPEAGVLSRAIGQAPQVEIEISEPVDLQAGDGVLLCSDGLSGYVLEAEIEKTLEHFQSVPEEAVSALIQSALQTGGEDNVTVQYIYVERGPAVHEVPGHRIEPRKPDVAPLGFFRKRGLVAITIVMAALIIGLVWRVRAHTSTNVARPVQDIERTNGGAGNKK